ncbi:hypothetical protein [Nonomuraea sp. NPDC049028]
MRAALVGLLAVPDGKRRSELERLRTPPRRASGRVMAEELRRVSEIARLGARVGRIPGRRTPPGPRRRRAG